MAYWLLADLVLALHLAFILFALFGSVLVLRWRWVAWVHLPAAVWGAFVEITGRICPLTPLENSFRSAAGTTPYRGDFIEHYVVPVIYPASLTRTVQLVFAAILIAVNTVVYGVVWRRGRRS